MKREETYSFTMDVSLEDLMHLDDDEWIGLDQVFIKNKQDILRAVASDIRTTEHTIEQLLKGKDYLRAGVYSTIKHMLEEIERYTNSSPVLPMPLFSGWSYYIRTTSDGVSLELWHEDNLEIMTDDDGDEYKSPTAVDQVMVVHSIKPEYLTINEFAERYEVEPVTIRQWIRRGKIRNAKKEGSEWRISELAIPLTGRGYKSGHYSWDHILNDIPAEYSFINDYKSATFMQDDADKKIYHALFFSNDYNEECKELDLLASEREKLEYILIGNPGVVSNETYISLCI